MDDRVTCRLDNSSPITNFNAVGLGGLHGHLPRLRSISRGTTQGPTIFYLNDPGSIFKALDFLHRLLVSTFTRQTTSIPAPSEDLDDDYLIDLFNKPNNDSQPAAAAWSYSQFADAVCNAVIALPQRQQERTLDSRMITKLRSTFLRSEHMDPPTKLDLVCTNRKRTLKEARRKSHSTGPITTDTRLESPFIPKVFDAVDMLGQADLRSSSPGRRSTKQDSLPSHPDETGTRGLKRRRSMDVAGPIPLSPTTPSPKAIRASKRQRKRISDGSDASYILGEASGDETDSTDSDTQQSFDPSDDGESQSILQGGEATTNFQHPDYSVEVDTQVEPLPDSVSSPALIRHVLPTPEPFVGQLRTSVDSNGPQDVAQSARPLQGQTGSNFSDPFFDAILRRSSAGSNKAARVSESITPANLATLDLLPLPTVQNVRLGRPYRLSQVRSRVSAVTLNAVEPRARLPSP